MKVKLNKDIQKQNKSLKQKIETLTFDLKTINNKLVAIQSQKTRSNATKRNLLIRLVMTKNKQKNNKKPKTDNSSDESDDEETQDINQLIQKNTFLKHTIMTQTTKIQQLYTQIVNLQEKEVEHQERIKAFYKLDRYVKRMSKNNRKVKTARYFL